jgi:hypothetical protein
MRRRKPRCDTLRAGCSVSCERVPRVYVLHVAAFVLSAAHHLDHVARATHVGWPVTADVTAFTYTLLIYPIIALGFLLRSRLYWLVAATGGLLLVTGVHFGPFALESPAEIVSGYRDAALGYAAVLDLLALVAVLLVIVVVYLRGSVEV